MVGRAIGMLALAGFSAAAIASDDPLPVDLEERVRVQLVLVDAVVLDRKDRTVGGLTVEDFDLLVDFKEVEIASLDVDCPRGTEEDARVGQPRRETFVPTSNGQPRRYVLVFDYYHLEHPTEALELAAGAFVRLREPGDQYMVISLGEVLRIEQPFTDSPDAVLGALDRMKQDIGLYFGPYDRLTERRFFQRILTLFDVMELLPGSKAAVLFSGPFIPDGFTYDPTFKNLAAMATRARTAIYSIDSGGLRTLYDANPQPFGGPPMLRRLSLETGGRPSSDTNDVGLALARAQRDFGCRYTIGFYDDRPKLDRDRTVRLFVRRPGHRVVAPTYYTVRSPEAQLRSRVRSARMMPEMFLADGLDVDLLLLRPGSMRRWEAVLDVGVGPGTLAGISQETPWVVHGALTRLNGTRVRSFRRELEATLSDPDSAAGLLQTLRVPPGRYRASVVLSHPDHEQPLTAMREVDIPAVPRNETFLVGPVVGRQRPVPSLGPLPNSDRAAPDASVPDPLTAGSARQGEPLTALTNVCFVGREQGPVTTRVERVLADSVGATVRAFDTSAVDLPQEGRVRCSPLIDRLPTSWLAPGSYTLAVTLAAGSGGSSRGAGFHVMPAAD